MTKNFTFPASKTEHIRMFLSSSPQTYMQANPHKYVLLDSFFPFLAQIF